MLTRIRHFNFSDRVAPKEFTEDHYVVRKKFNTLFFVKMSDQD